MKKFKYLMLALFVSFAFVLSACGEGQLGVEAQANIGNPESYTVATNEEITAFQTIINNEQATDVSTYRMTMTMTMPGETEEQNMAMKFNCVYTILENSYEMAVKMDITMGGETQTIKMYIKEDYAYLDFVKVDDETKDLYGSTKVKIPMEISGMEEMLASLQSMDLSQILPMVQDMVLETEGVTVKVNVEGTTKRYELSEEGSKIYLVFENDLLTAVQAEISMADVKVVIEKFDGSIEYPNLDSFKDISNLLA